MNLGVRELPRNQRLIHMSNSKKPPAVPGEELKSIHLKGLDFEKLGPESTSSFAWFVQVNGRIPSMTHFGQGQFEHLILKLLKDYAVREENIVLNESFSASKQRYLPQSWTVFIRKDLVIDYKPLSGLVLLHGHLLEKSYIIEWIEYIKARVGFESTCEDAEAGVEDKNPETRIYLLELQGFGDLKLRPFDIPRPQLDIELHYNRDFRAVHDHILGRLKTPGDSGLVLLHGKPGTGKTTYIRYLSFLLPKRIIYIPPQVVANLASVDFITFMLKYPNSVLIIEDAEEIITASSGRTESISGLLNITDGLLGDCLNLQIICTFNTDIHRIDRALLRKGRLIELYEFDKLCRERSENLLKQLGKERELDQGMTLADLFHIDDPRFRFAEKGRIGFKTG